MNLPRSRAIPILLVSALTAPAAADTWVTTLNAYGQWTMSDYKWGLTTPCYPDNGNCFMPGAPEFRWHVTINSNINLDVPVTLTELAFASNTALTAPAATANSLVVEELFTWPSGRIDTNGAVDSLGLLHVTDDALVSTYAWLDVDTTLTNHNIAIQDGPLRLDGEIFNPIASTWTIDASAGDIGIHSFFDGVFHNDGLLRKIGPFTTNFTGGLNLDNAFTGEVLVEEGALIYNTNGPFICAGEIDTLPGGVFDLRRPGNFLATSIVQGGGTIRLPLANTNFVVDVAGTWNVSGATEITNGTVNFHAPCFTNDLVLTTYNTRVTGDVHVNGMLDWTAATMAGPGTTYANGACYHDGSTQLGTLSGRTLQLSPAAVLTIDTRGPIGENGAVIAISNDAVMEFITPLDIASMPADPLDATIENDGLIVKSGPGRMYCGWLINNRGDIVIAEGAFQATDSGFIQTAGETHLGGGSLSCSAGPIDIQGGKLTGGGFIGDGVLTNVNSNGIIAPGPGFQMFDMIPGTLTLGPSSRLEFDLGGATAAPVPGVNHDAILAQYANLDGELHVTILSDPDPAAEYIVLESVTNIVGSFTNVASGGDLEEEEGRGMFTVYYGLGSPYPADQVVVTNFRELCRADLNGDGAVNVSDLLILLAGWGPCQAVCPADVDRDGSVNVWDLLEILSNWGACP